MLQGDFTQYGVYAGMLFVLLVGRLTRTETRTLLLAVAGVVCAPFPETLFVAGVLAIVFKVVDLVKGVS